MNYKESKQYRLPGYNYARAGLYFVTICTKDHEMFFGEVVGGQMVLSEIGEIANECWLAIPKHFPHVKLYEHIIMPNHVHGILQIDWESCRDFRDMEHLGVGTQNFVFLQNQNPDTMDVQNKFGPQSKNLSSIIRGFKIGVKEWVTINNDNFIWQPRFRDTIIRDEKSLYNFRKYIRNNPRNWELDHNNPDFL